MSEAPAPRASEPPRTARRRLDSEQLAAAMNAHWVWMEYRLHVCVGPGCAENIAAE